VRARAAALLLAFAGACSGRRIFAYEPSRVSGEAAEPVPHGAVVRELADARPKTPLNHNLKQLALIPLVPFAVSYRDHPERTYLDDTNNLNGFVPGLDLARAVAAEVGARGIFERCRFSEIATHEERFEVRGRIRDFHVSEGYLTYGISVLSVAPHLLGFPEGTVKTVLTFDLELYDRRQGRVVWTRECSSTRTRATWIYDSGEADHVCLQLSAMAADLLPDAVRDLGAAAAQASAAPVGP
jgi:hypothetical protein